MNLIKENEELQRQIIDDPMLREKLFERLKGMRHSNSDFTRPYTQYSSKHLAERRTGGESNLFHTPLRSDEGKYSKHIKYIVLFTAHILNIDSKHEGASYRLTQFANSEMRK